MVVELNIGDSKFTHRKCYTISIALPTLFKRGLEERINNEGI